MLSSLFGFFTFFALLHLHDKCKTALSYIFNPYKIINNLEAFPFLDLLENLLTFYLNIYGQFLLTESSSSSFLFF